MAKPDPMGATFAERKAAAAGKASFSDPTPDPAQPAENTSFGDRAQARGGKAVKSDEAEDKAVKSAATKRVAAKKA